MADGKEVKIRLVSRYDGKGAVAAESSVRRLGQAVRGAFMGIGGEFRRLSSVMHGFLYGGIWGASAQLFTTVWTKAIDWVHSKANAAREAAKKENEELYAMVDQRDKEIVLLKDQLQQAQRDYNSLKTARMLEVTDGDVEGAKKRIAGLIREVNRCITMMSEK